MDAPKPLFVLKKGIHYVFIGVHGWEERSKIYQNICMLLSNLTLEFRQFSIKIFYLLIFKTSFYEMYVPEFQYDITGTSKELEGFIILKLNDVLSFLSFRKVAEFKSCKTCADP